jgi:hypothetical protein
LVSLNSRAGNEEFIRKLSEDVRCDDRFSLHYATDIDDRVANLGLLVSYASHIKADMILRINCHEPIAGVRSEAKATDKPIVKVRAHELSEIRQLCGETASTMAFPGDEEAEVIIVAREIQKRIANSISIDSVLMSLRDVSAGTAELNEKLREFRSYSKKRTFFVSIDIFPRKEQYVDEEVKRCSELIRTLHEHYSRKNAILLDGARLILR